MFNPPGIIDHKLPVKNKYTNFKNIETIIFTKLSKLRLNKFLNLIKLNYLRNRDNIFLPQLENITPYFIGHNTKTFVTFYNEEVYYNLNKVNIIQDYKPISVITSRPMHVSINNTKEDIQFDAYYVDYLCVDKMYRKKGIAPQMIQTHNYNQRHLNKNIVVSIFKREDELTGIVPICVYSTYGFKVDTWTKPNNLDAVYNIIEINTQNLNFLYDFMKKTNVMFDVSISSCIANISELINTKNIFVYVIIVDNNITCAYFFRKTCVQIEKGIEVLNCFASICNCDENIFIQGFKISFWKIASDNFFGFASIENISHNNIIINNIILKTKPLIISPTAYFFYNFAYPTFKPEKVLIIN
jgi:hypothetical protein